jgi:branched-chain amino acid transport
MTFSYLCLSIGLMALVTYIPRVLPLILFRRHIENRFFQSFLLYMPYAILAAMVFPDVFSSTGGLISAICGTAVALVMSYFRFGLMPVALASTCTVFLVEQLLIIL